MPRNPARAGQVGRPRIGVKVDFRMPEEVDAEIQSQADALGIPHDEMYRILVFAGLDSTATCDVDWFVE